MDREHQTSETPAYTVYDVQVSTEDTLRARILAVSQSPAFMQNLHTISRLDDDLAVLIQAIAHGKARHMFYREFAKDPANFIQRWLKSQKHDLEVILGEGDGRSGVGRMGDEGVEFQRGGKAGAWDSQVVWEAVRYMLAKPEVQR